MPDKDFDISFAIFCYQFANYKLNLVSTNEFENQKSKYFYYFEDDAIYCNDNLIKIYEDFSLDYSKNFNDYDLTKIPFYIKYNNKKITKENYNNYIEENDKNFFYVLFNY
jgi:hypothetical protein